MLSITIIIGKLSADPEKKAVGSTSLVELSVESESSFKGKDGAWVKKTATDRVTVWGGQGDACAKNLRAGSLVGVVAHTESKPWKDKVINNLVADKIFFLDGKGASRDEFDQTARPPQRSGGRPVTPEAPISDDDIPF